MISQTISTVSLDEKLIFSYKFDTTFITWNRYSVYLTELVVGLTRADVITSR